MAKEIHIINKLNEQEFEKIFKEYYKPLCGFAYKFVKDSFASKEIVNDVFFKLWEKKDSIDMKKSIKSYLFTSVNNRSLNYLRDNKKNISAETLINAFDKDDGTDASSQMIYEEINDKIEETLSKLPEKCSKTFKLSRFSGKKYKEIAEELKISIKTVESHISKALKALRIDLAEYLSLFLLIILNL